MKTFSAPGKVFLLGEYAVLAGLPAWVAAIGPRFELRVSEEQKGTPPSLSGRPAHQLFHPDSPAGRLIRYFTEMGKKPLNITFHDPLAGRGGFGASTAQFALLYRACIEHYGTGEHFTLRDQAIAFNQPPFLSGWKACWNLYRLLASSEPLLPSGADLAAQWCGGIIKFETKTPSVQPLETVPSSAQPGIKTSLWIFSATQQKHRKVATHEHLKKLADDHFPHRHDHLLQALETILSKAEPALTNRDSLTFADLLNEYAEALLSHELESSFTTEDRKAFHSLAGVLAVKGTGALQADGLLVLIDSAKVDREKLLRVAQERGLSLLSSGLHVEKGLTCT